MSLLRLSMMVCGCVLWLISMLMMWLIFVLFGCLILLLSIGSCVVGDVVVEFDSGIVFGCVVGGRLFDGMLSMIGFCLLFGVKWNMFYGKMILWLLMFMKFCRLMIILCGLLFVLIIMLIVWLIILLLWCVILLLSSVWIWVWLSGCVVMIGGGGGGGGVGDLGCCMGFGCVILWCGFFGVFGVFGCVGVGMGGIVSGLLVVFLIGLMSVLLIGVGGFWIGSSL